MAFLKKDRLPDLPSPPEKYSDMSNEDFDDFPKYTPAVNLDEDKFENRSRISPMPIPEFPRTDVAEHQTGFERKPLFIKIDKYEDAVMVLNSIRDKLEDASRVISDLRQIRKDEDEQLDEWSEHIRAIKEKLMSVDSMLFE